MAGLTVSIKVMLSPRMRKAIEKEALAQGVSIGEMMRRCIARFIHAPDVSLYREVHLGRNGFQPERALEYLAARKPLVADLTAGDHLETSLRQVLRRHLPTTQARRLEMRLQGRTFEEIGADEGCSKQAAEQAVSRALVTLRDNHDFLGALARLFPDSGLDGATLLMATSYDENLQVQVQASP